MLAADTVETLARELSDARRSCTALGHFSARFPGMTIADGYAIQQAWVRLELAAGRHVLGRKIGLTSRAMQQASQIDEPDFAPLLDDMFFAPGDIPAARFIAPRVEVELAFVLGAPLRGPGLTQEAVLSATAQVVPAIEIIDARIEQFDRLSICAALMSRIAQLNQSPSFSGLVSVRESLSWLAIINEARL